MKLNFRKTGTGKPLVILHGLFGSADNWMSIAKGLEENYTLYLLDQRNHGDIAPRPYPVHHQTILEGLNAVDIKNLSSRKEAEDKLTEYISERGVRQFLLKNLTRKEGAFAWKINLPVITKQIENVGEEITSDKPFSGPALFMGGANSDYIKSSDKEDIENLFPDNHIIHIKNTGHWLHAEQPEAVVATLNAFLGT